MEDDNEQGILISPTPQQFEVTRLLEVLQEEDDSNVDKELNASEQVSLNNDQHKPNDDTENKRKIENNKKFDAALRDLEGDEIHLGKLLEMKEREWDTILKLKKLREIKIARMKTMKRKRDLGDMFEVHTIHESIQNHKLVGSIGLTEMRKRIRVFDKEIQELVEEMFAENQVVPLPESGLYSAKDSYLDSTAELKSLVKQQNMSLTTTPTIDSTEGDSSRVIIWEEKVEVASLIDDCRLKSQEDKEIRRPSSSTKPLPIFDQLDFAPETSYTDLLYHAKTLFEREKKLNITKTKKVLGMSSVSNNNLSVGTTLLAKLLSSSRAVDETVSYNHNKPSSSNSDSSEENLSLANLLASSKSREKLQISKKKKATDTLTQMYFMCRGCHINEAEFVCSACENQWYCSKECQVAAWDDHSDVCSS